MEQVGQKIQNLTAWDNSHHSVALGLAGGVDQGDLWWQGNGAITEVEQSKLEHPFKRCGISGAAIGPLRIGRQGGIALILQLENVSCKGENMVIGGGGDSTEMIVMPRGQDDMGDARGADFNGPTESTI